MIHLYTCYIYISFVSPLLLCIWRNFKNAKIADVHILLLKFINPVAFSYPVFDLLLQKVSTLLLFFSVVFSLSTCQSFFVLFGYVVHWVVCFKSSGKSMLSLLFDSGFPFGQVGRLANNVMQHLHGV
jgi:hypothetical protein